MSKVTLETLKADFEALSAETLEKMSVHFAPNAHMLRAFESPQSYFAFINQDRDFWEYNWERASAFGADATHRLFKCAELISIVSSYDDETEGLNAAMLWKLQNA